MTTESSQPDPALPLPWWDQWQGRIEWEVDCFERRDLPVEVLEDPRRGDRRLVLGSQARLDNGDTTPVKVVFPASYPHRPFTVYAPDLALPRHQAPGGNLCVFPRGDKHWHPHIAAADAVADRVPRLVRLVATGGDVLRDNEDPQGEPFTAYYETEVQGSILVDDRAFAFKPQSGDHGKLEIALRGDDADWMLGHIDTPDGRRMRVGQGLLLHLRHQNGTLLTEAPSTGLRNRYGSQPLSGRWLYLDSAPLVGTADDFWEACRAAASPDLLRWLEQETGDQLVGVCFEEEIRQGFYGLGWTFLFRQTQQTKVHGKGARGGKSGNPQKSGVVRTVTDWQFVRALRWTDDNLSVRIPELAPLRNKTALVVGLGTLGAPVALELTKERIKAIRLLDGDFMDPGTSVRHPVGFDYAGVAKVLAVAETARSHNPDINVDGSIVRIGHGSLDSGDTTEQDVLTAHLQASDLLISATAEHDVNRYLDTLATQLAVPRLYLWSQSGYGGVVALLRQGQTACYHCLNTYLSDLAKAGTPAIEVPSDWEDTTAIQGPGCADQTFTATHADMLPISIQAARVANGILCDPEDGYPAFDGDLFTVQVRKLDGTPIPPHWTIHTLPPNPECPTCCPA